MFWFCGCKTCGILAPWPRLKPTAPALERQSLNQWATRESVLSLSHVRIFMTPWTGALRLLCPWDSLGKNTRVGCHFLLQEIFLTQGLKLSSVAPVLQMDSLPLSHQGNPIRMNSVFNNINWWEFQKEMVFRKQIFENKLVANDEDTSILVSCPLDT